MDVLVLLFSLFLVLVLVDLVRIRDLMIQPAIVDGRNIYDPIVMARIGFRYRPVGRGFGPDGKSIAEPHTEAAAS